MKKTIAAVSVALALAAGAAAAQDEAMSMDVGLSMLELAAERALERKGIEGVSAMDLTLSQLAEVKNIIDDDSRGGTEMKAAIEAAVRRGE